MRFVLVLEYLFSITHINLGDDMLEFIYTSILYMFAVYVFVRAVK